MTQNILVSVTTVLHDSSGVIADFIREMTDVLKDRYEHYEIVLVDNGSRDETVSIVRQMMKHHDHIRMVVLSREYDQQVAFTAALESSIGDYVIIMDLNTDPPALVPEMLEKSAAGIDIVTAEVSGRPQQTLLYGVLSRIFYRISNLVTEHRIDLNWSNFVCFSRKTVNAILQIKDRVRYLKYLQLDIGYSHETLRYEQINRHGRRRKTYFWNRFFFALETLVSNSEKLIRLATSLALMTSLLSAGYIFYALGIRIFRSDVAQGWTSLSIVLSVMFAVMFFILFILGQYIALVYKETRKGPLYHVADEYNSSILFKEMEEKNVI